MSNNVAYLAAGWVRAEQERKMRKQEARLAWLLAFRAGVRVVTVQHAPDDVTTDLVADTPEAKAALDVAREARAAYRSAAARSGGMRGALTKAVAPLAQPPKENEAIRKAYAELCEREGREAKLENLFAQDNRGTMQ